LWRSEYPEYGVSETPLHLNSSVLNNIFLWSAHTETIKPTALVVIARYGLLFLYPHPLIHQYGYDQIPLSHWSDATLWLVIAALVALAWLVWRNWKRKLPLGFGVAFFAITYSVYSNLLFFAPDTMADRYVHSVGWALDLSHLLLFRWHRDLRVPVLKIAGNGRALHLCDCPYGVFARTVVLTGLAE
jgi:hypothetical protein